MREGAGRREGGEGGVASQDGREGGREGVQVLERQSRRGDKWGKAGVGWGG